MRYRVALALILGATTLGILGGWTGGALQAPSYTATAVAVVYPMPGDLQNVISPDEAHTLQSIYQAGALQDAVIAQVLPWFPGVTAHEIRNSVHVEIVAYSPYVRVSATSSDSARAVALANNFSDNWTLLTTQLYNDTFSNLQNVLNARIQSVMMRIAGLQATIAAHHATQVTNAAVLQALQAQLGAEEDQQRNLVAAVSDLTTYHDHGSSVAYTAVRASPQAVITRPDMLVSSLIGAAWGLLAGICFVLWRLGLFVLAGPPRVPLDPPERTRALSPLEGWR